MAKASSKKTKKDSVTEEPKETKSNENQKNMEDLKDILQDLKTVLSNLGVNISQLEVSLSSSQETSEEKKADEPTDNDTLLISEIQNKVVLPYKIKDVEKALSENSQYKTIEDVINVEYTLQNQDLKKLII